MKSILVIGGTGTMGSALVNLLSGESEWVVFAVSRGSRKACAKDCHYVFGDVMDDKFFEEVIGAGNYDAIVDFMWYSPQIFEQRIEKLLTSTKHYICLSSCAVYAHSDKTILEDNIRFFDTADDTTKNDTKERHYHLEKARIENIIRKQASNNWTIIRPHVTMNYDHMPLNIWDDKIWLWRVAHGLPIVMYEDLAWPKSSYTMAIDVAKMIVVLLNSEKSFGETYNVVSDTVLSGNELLEMFSHILKGKGIDLHAVRASDSKSFYEFSPLAAERITYDRGGDRVFGNSKIRSISSIEFSNFENELSLCIDKWIEHIEEIDVRFFIKEHAFMDRLMHAHSTLRALSSLKQKKNYLIIRHPIVGKAYRNIQPIAATVKKIWK